MNQHANNTSDIKVMFREHDHTVECVSWAPESANKSIAEAFEDVSCSMSEKTKQN